MWKRVLERCGAERVHGWSGYSSGWWGTGGLSYSIRIAEEAVTENGLVGVRDGYPIVIALGGEK